MNSGGHGEQWTGSAGKQWKGCGAIERNGERGGQRGAGGACRCSPLPRAGQGSRIGRKARDRQGEEAREQWGGRRGAGPRERWCGGEVPSCSTASQCPQKTQLTTDRRSVGKPSRTEDFIALSAFFLGPALHPPQRLKSRRPALARLRGLQTSEGGGSELFCLAASVSTVESPTPLRAGDGSAGRGGGSARWRRGRISRHTAAPRLLHRVRSLEPASFVGRKRHLILGG